jgi:hypothetical protein
VRNPWSTRSDVPQPPLFSLPARAVTLQALLDLEEHSVVFGVQTLDPITDTLNALWVSSPVDLDRHLKALHEAHSEFLTQLYNAHSPFPL